MIDHTGVIARDYARSLAWYEKALGPLGYKKLLEFPASVMGHTDVAGLGEAATGKPDFWIAAATAGKPATSPLHIAFRAGSRAQVDAFHVAALAAGGTDNGPPGLRPQYHPNYYGAFVLDPDGHNVEAVCHGPA